MKKCILCIVVILLVSLLMACGKTNTADELEKNNEYSEEVQLVLNREIFSLINDFPRLYEYHISNIYKTNAYVDNWKIGRILNEENFRNIEWDVSSGNEGSKVIVFRGESIVRNNEKVAVGFLLSKGAKVPLANGIVAESDFNTLKVTARDFLKQGEITPKEASITAEVFVLCTIAEQYSSAALNIASKYQSSKLETNQNTESYEFLKEFKEPVIDKIPTPSKEELSLMVVDEAGVLPEYRFDSYTPEVTVSGYMKTDMQFILDEKIALKGYWEEDQWDILEELFIAKKYNLQQGERYTLKGVLNYDALQQIEVINGINEQAKNNKTPEKIDFPVTESPTDFVQDKPSVDSPHTHSYGSWKNDNNDSTHSRTCSCGAKEKEEHIFDSGEVTKEPTTTSTGIRTYTCVECSAITWKTLPKIETPQVSEPEVSEKNESYSSETIDYDYKCICNYCGYDDGIKHLKLERGVEEDVIWNCSSCGKENWNYMTLN